MNSQGSRGQGTLELVRQQRKISEGTGIHEQNICQKTQRESVAATVTSAFVEKRGADRRKVRQVPTTWDSDRKHSCCEALNSSVCRCELSGSILKSL